MPTEGNHPYLKHQVLKNKLWVTELLEKLQMGKRGAPRRGTRFGLEHLTHGKRLGAPWGGEERAHTVLKAHFSQKKRPP